MTNALLNVDHCSRHRERRQAYTGHLRSLRRGRITSWEKNKLATHKREYRVLIMIQILFTTVSTNVTRV